MGVAEQVRRSRREVKVVPRGAVAPAVMRGTVAAVERGRVWVTVPAVTQEQLHGPVSVMHGMVLDPGDRVVVASVGGHWEDLVVITASKPSVPAPHTHAAGDVVSGVLDSARVPVLGAEHLSAGSVGVSQLQDGSVGSAQLQDGAVGRAELDSVVAGAVSRVLDPVRVWSGPGVVETTWDANLGWVSWVDVSTVGATALAEWVFPAAVDAVGVARPSGWQCTVVTVGLTGVSMVSPHVAYVDGAGAVTGVNAEVGLTAWSDWSYRVEHDFILPANCWPRPTFALSLVEASASGRVGITAPRVATKSERSQ